MWIGAFKSRFLLLLAVVYANHTQVEAAISASLIISVSFVDSLDALRAAVTCSCWHWVLYVYETCCYVHCAVAPERLLDRTVHSRDEYRRLTSVPCSVFATGVVNDDHGHPAGYPFGAYAVRSRCKRSPFHSIEDLRSAMLSRIKQVPEGESRLRNKSSISICLRSLPGKQ